MAIDVKEVIRVDAKQATREVKDLAKAHRELGSAANPPGGGGGGRGRGASGTRAMNASERAALAREVMRVRAEVQRYNRAHNVTDPAAARNLASAGRAVIEEATSRARGIGRTIADEMANRAGPRIAKAVASYAVHEGASLYFRLSRNPNGGNQTIDAVEAGVTGAAGGATMGYAVGGGYGAFLMGGLGALTGVLSTLQEQTNALVRARTGREVSDRAMSRAVASQTSAAAFGKVIENIPHEARLAEMNERLRKMTYHRAGLDVKLHGMGDRIDTTEYAETDAKRRELQSAIMALKADIAQERMNIPMGRLLDTGAVTDQYAKKGLYAGAQVNVADVNDRILAKLTEGVNYFRKIADRFGDTDLAIPKPTAPAAPSASLVIVR